MLAPNGDPVRAVVLPSLYQIVHPRPDSPPTTDARSYADGSFIPYDISSHVVDIKLTSDGALNVAADGGITLSGDVTVTGSLTAGGDVSDSTSSMSDDRTIYNSHTHIGNQGKPTSPPQQSQK